MASSPQCSAACTDGLLFIAAVCACARTGPSPTVSSVSQREVQPYSAASITVSGTDFRLGGPVCLFRQSLHARPPLSLLLVLPLPDPCASPSLRALPLRARICPPPSARARKCGSAVAPSQAPLSTRRRNSRAIRPPTCSRASPSPGPPRVLPVHVKSCTTKAQGAMFTSPQVCQRLRGMRNERGQGREGSGQRGEGVSYAVFSIFSERAPSNRRCIPISRTCTAWTQSQKPRMTCARPRR